MLIALLAIVVGFALLFWSAEKFINAAASMAKAWHMSPLNIGIFIIGFGTSSPELIVSALAALSGNQELAVGNAIGSNTLNIGLILGVTALILPVAVHSNIIKKEMPVLLAIVLLIGILIFDGFLSLLDSLLLLLGFAILVAWIVRSSKRAKRDALATDVKAELAHVAPLSKALVIWCIASLVLMIASSKLLVWGATNFASALGLSDLIIGLTIVAFGTSLPEFASSLVALKKAEHDMVIGNIVGSNMFNILAVVGVSGVIFPGVISSDILYRDWLTMFLMTALLYVLVRKQQRISRLSGSLLLGSYIGYTLWLIASV